MHFHGLLKKGTTKIYSGNRKVTYTGDLNKEGKPHGYGGWTFQKGQISIIHIGYFKKGKEFGYGKSRSHP